MWQNHPHKSSSSSIVALEADIHHANTLGSLKRVSPRDLWVMIDDSEVVDRLTFAKDNLRRFYLYIHSLPLLTHPDPHVIVFNYML